MQINFKFENTYSKLSEKLFTRVAPTPVQEPKILIFNSNLAKALGLKVEDAETLAEILCGNKILKGADPLAQAYAGHQFGYFNILGDGRAILLGEHVSPNGTRFDVQLKGAGPTPYSRRGDGRAAVGPMLREYIISEAMSALGISTTRSLAVIATGEKVFRENPLNGAVLSRIASSHIRVGTFEYAAAQSEGESLVRALSEYSIQRHYPELLSSENKYISFLKAVMDRQAALVAKWQSVGFIHGVMNTDNMTISGETIDYGPCAFMDHYDSETVFSSIDHQGRYAYGNQPRIAQWNLARLAETLLPLLDNSREKAIQVAEEVIDSFSEKFKNYWLFEMRKKIGLQEVKPEDQELINNFLEIMKTEHADYTNSFRELINDQLPLAFSGWLTKWNKRKNDEDISPAQSKELMNRANPVVIPRNHFVEEALAAAESGEMTLFYQLLQVVKQPFLNDSVNLLYRKAPTPEQRVVYTYCGT